MLPEDYEDHKDFSAAERKIFTFSRKERRWAVRESIYTKEEIRLAFRHRRQVHRAIQRLIKLKTQNPDHQKREELARQFREHQKQNWLLNQERSV